SIWLVSGKAFRPRIPRQKPSSSSRTNEQIGRWLNSENLQLTRIVELLAQQGVPVTHSTLRRYVRRTGLSDAKRDTVRMAATAPGEEFDFERLGPLVDPTTGKRQTVWALNIVLVYSRHCFVWPLGP